MLVWQMWLQSSCFKEYGLYALEVRIFCVHHMFVADVLGLFSFSSWHVQIHLHSVVLKLVNSEFMLARARHALGESQSCLAACSRAKLSWSPAAARCNASVPASHVSARVMSVGCAKHDQEISLILVDAIVSDGLA
mmetsp:Transcript_1677/g.5777  ORF Transcript_1677/g.5777 Transcript_1677/m.5777 type:complete len:136 (+) Transcript_1677:1290-1697(+)